MILEYEAAVRAAVERKRSRRFIIIRKAYMTREVHIIGGGLAGCEAAWQVVRGGGRAVLHEMRPQRQTPAHKTDWLAELVCSNSLKSEQENGAPWLLKEELRRLKSLLLDVAARTRVPAGHALTVDRELFAPKSPVSSRASQRLSYVAKR